jgi:uncharacterized oligopeptide transporter (OPT) family protein
MLAVFLGGFVRRLAQRGEAAEGGGERRGSDPGILAASGIVAGEGLAGILVAGSWAWAPCRSRRTRSSAAWPARWRCW